MPFEPQTFWARVNQEVAPIIAHRHQLFLLYPVHAMPAESKLHPKGSDDVLEVVRLHARTSIRPRRAELNIDGTSRRGVKSSCPDVGASDAHVEIGLTAIARTNICGCSSRRPCTDIFQSSGPTSAGCAL